MPWARPRRSTHRARPAGRLVVRIRARAGVTLAVAGMALVGCQAPGKGADPTPQTSTAPFTAEDVTRTGDFHPRGGAAFTDAPDYYEDGCRFTVKVSVPPKIGRCVYGDPAGTPVALVGDSKIGQWLPALQSIAGVEHWRLLFYSRSSCPFATGATEANCANFSRLVQARLRDEEHPALVISSHISRTDAVISTESAMLTELHEAVGTKAVLLADTPQPSMASIPACLQDATDYFRDCSYPKNDGSGTPALRAIAADVPGAAFISMNDLICPTSDRCPPVLDGILLYRQGSHLTKTFIDALAPALHQRLIDAGVAKGPVLGG